MVSRERSGFTLNIIDTPGIVEGGYINNQALDITKRSLFILYIVKPLIMITKLVFVWLGEQVSS